MLDQTEWNLRMLEKGGEELRPHLDRLWEWAHRIYEGWTQGQLPKEGEGVLDAAREYLQQTEAKSAAAVEQIHSGDPTPVPASPGSATGTPNASHFQVGDRVNIKGSSGRKPTLVEAIHPDGRIKVKAQREPVAPADLDLVMKAHDVLALETEQKTAKTPGSGQPRRRMHLFQIGDRIKGKSSAGVLVEGVVEELHSRRTVVRTDDGTSVYVDNRTVGLLNPDPIPIPEQLPKQFRGIYEEAHAHPRRNRTIPFWTVGNEEAQRLAAELDGLDLSGRTRRTSTSFMRHGEKRHGEDGEIIEDQMPITPEDIARLPE